MGFLEAEVTVRSLQGGLPGLFQEGPQSWGLPHRGGLLHGYRKLDPEFIWVLSS
jgi:hypothetical protein